MDATSKTKQSTDHWPNCQENLDIKYNCNNNKENDTKDSNLINLTVNKDAYMTAYKNLTNNHLGKTRYLLKPAAFILIGICFISAGVILTIFHFMEEIPSTSEKEQNSHVYFDYGPVFFASGLILFMIGIVWFSIKYQKWARGTAAPIATAAAAAAASLVTSATITLEKRKLSQGRLASSESQLK
ncbi:unnamed protein product [Clavelina lepadiformis]|uniref:Uncharacterized protein n=1 Tax=Clavelina lepadiformis TaxID=159417 RepID=A0ABP0GDZ9_CLALP